MKMFKFRNVQSIVQITLEEEVVSTDVHIILVMTDCGFLTLSFISVLSINGKENYIQNCASGEDKS